MNDDDFFNLKEEVIEEVKMKENRKVFEVRRIYLREDIVKDRIIFELKEYESTGKSEWVYIAPNAQEHSQEQLEVILERIKELNKNDANNPKPD